MELTKARMRMSLKARRRPFQTPLSSSAWDTRSRWIRSTATFCSMSLQSHLETPLFWPGKSGKTTTATRAAIKLPVPSMMKSPLPGRDPHGAIGAGENASCDKSRESRGKKDTRVQNRRPQGELFASIPAAQRVHGAGEEGRLYDTEEEADREEMLVACRRSGRGICVVSRED